MYTRCPACQAVYELQARLLAEAAGVLRCGNCGKTFNGLSELFERHPEASDEPLRGSGMPPMLEHPDMIQAELPVEYFDEPEQTSEAAAATEPLPGFDGEEASGPGRRWLWPAISAALLVVLAAQLWSQWQTPGSTLANWLGGSHSLDAGLDPNEVVQIVSRDMHPHPGLDDAVVISASLRNQASAAVPFPIVEVRFFDASQQVLGVRRLAPDEYVRDPEAIARGLPSGVVMPILLEFVVGTGQPAGFQMRFHPASAE